ncbi:MAG: helix-turn-helix domain-containing protein [Fimbriimonadaceae bacterium]
MTDRQNFDPLAYIENAFLDTNPEGVAPIAPPKERGKRRVKTGAKTKFRKTALQAPRPRRARGATGRAFVDAELHEMLEKLPRNIEFLGRFFSDEVTGHYYQDGFKESRADLIRKLVDPELNLEEASRLLGVCPATVRRYTNRGWLGHDRTKGGQRRFRLSHIVAFVDRHGRVPED